MKSMRTLYWIYEDEGKHERLGQFFYNRYIMKGGWPELFYATDGEAGVIIRDWLTDNGYEDKPPRRLRDI